MIYGGQLVAKMLKQEKIDAVFTLCGGHIMPIYNGLVDEGIRIVDFRHEQAARVRTRALRGARWNARSRPANRRALTCASTRRRTRR